MFDINTLEGEYIPLTHEHFKNSDAHSYPIEEALKSFINDRSISIIVCPLSEEIDIRQNGRRIGKLMTTGILDEWIADYNDGEHVCHGKLHIFKQAFDPKIEEEPDDRLWIGIEKNTKTSAKYINEKGLLTIEKFNTPLERAVATEINEQTLAEQSCNENATIENTIEHLFQHGVEDLNWLNLMFHSGCHDFVKTHMIDIETFLSEYVENIGDDLTQQIRPGSGIIFTQIAQLTFEETARKIAIQAGIKESKYL